nr:MAG TPA: hypothetical protein [Caudoviricetes sp.]
MLRSPHYGNPCPCHQYRPEGALNTAAALEAVGRAYSPFMSLMGICALIVCWTI